MMACPLGAYSNAYIRVRQRRHISGPSPRAERMFGIAVSIVGSAMKTTMSRERAFGLEVVDAVRRGERKISEHQVAKSSELSHVPEPF